MITQIATMYQAIILGAQTEIPAGFTTGFASSWCSSGRGFNSYDYTNCYYVPGNNSWSYNRNSSRVYYRVCWSCTAGNAALVPLITQVATIYQAIIAGVTTDIPVAFTTGFTTGNPKCSWFNECFECQRPAEYSSDHFNSKHNTKCF